MEFADIITKPRLDGITYKKGIEKNNTIGSLVVTGHHLIFQSNNDNASSDQAWLLHHKGVDLVLAETKPQNTGGYIILKCKNFLIVTIEVFSSFDDCTAVARSIQVLSNLTDVKLHYPFFFQCSFRMYEDGWDCFSIEENEFIRLQTQSDFWRISHVNKNYAVCPSYPELVIVPKSVTDDTIRASAQFREGFRFPVLSYYHKETRAVVVRCSQPAVGPNSRRCKEDEELMNSMLNFVNRGYIIDTRSQNIALTAKTRGYGFEPELHYPRWKRVHKNTPRWQYLQDSVAKLVEGCNDPTISTDKWLSKVNSSLWLQYVADTLTCACVVSQCLDREEMSVIVHGSEGTDSTLIVVSLVQIILDPDSRSIRGFEALIEREWIRAGHPFGFRCAHLAYGKSKNSIIPEAPTFLLFMDCVWQIYRQFPCSFEFTEQFLINIVDHAYSSEFGTFLCNNEKEKRDNKVKQKTVSLWSYLNRPEILQQFLSPFYDPNKTPLWPSVAPQSIELWQRMFCRFTRDWTRLDDEIVSVVKLADEEAKINAKVIKLQRQLESLDKAATKLNVPTC